MDDPSALPPPPPAQPWKPPVVDMAADAPGTPSGPDPANRAASHRRMLAVAVGCAAVAASVLAGVVDGRSGSNLVGYGLGALLFPCLALGLVTMKSRRAGLTAFTVVAAVVATILTLAALGDLVDDHESERTERAVELLSPLGTRSLRGTAGACLVDEVAALDDDVISALERNTEPPGTAVAERLRDLVVECGVDRMIVAGFIDGVRQTPDASTAPYDLICMREAVGQPSAALLHATANVTMLDLPDSIDDHDIVGAALFTWRSCIDGGAVLADSIALLGGPEFRPASIACLGDWFDDEDDRLSRLFLGALTEIEAGMRGCLTADEVTAYERWVTRT